MNYIQLIEELWGDLHINKNKYYLQLQLNGKKVHTEYFDTIEAAIAKRDELLPKLYGEFHNKG